MTKEQDLTKFWKDGKLEYLSQLIKEIQETDNNRSLSDDYLDEIGAFSRKKYNPAQECEYGIVWVIIDYVLPYLKQLQSMQAEIDRLREAFENNKLKEKIEFAKQAVDLFFKTENESKLLEIAEWE